MKFLLYLYLNFCALIPTVSHAQMEREWVQRYNGAGNSFDVVSGLISQKDGGCIVYGSEVGLGSGLDFCVIKYDKNGNMIWNSVYTGKGNQSDQVNHAVPDDSGNIYVTGFTSLDDGRVAFAVGKVSYAGEFVWVKAIEEQDYFVGIGNSICMTSSGKITAAAYIRDTTNESRLLLAVLSPTGELIRKQFAESPRISSSMRIAPAENENFIVAFEAEFSFNSIDIAVAKFDINLNRLWLTSFDGSANYSSDKVSDLKTVPTGKIYVSGSVVNDPTYSDYITICMDFSGSVLWQNLYSGDFYDIPYSLAVDPEGIAYVTGVSATGMDLETENIFTLKIASDGSTLWSRSYNGSGNGIDRGSSVAVDNIGNVYVGGYSDRGNVQVTYAFLQYSPAGDLNYFDRYSVADVPEDFGYAVAVDSTGSVYMTGISAGIGTDYDIATLKYSRSVGVNSNAGEVISTFSLSQNFPNPFNPRTVITFDLMTTGMVSLKIFDITGNEIMDIVNEFQRPGSYSVEFDGGNLPSGVYFYSLNLDGRKSKSKKMVLLK